MPVCSMRCRKRRISSGSSGLLAQRLAFLVKICRASHPCTSARSTARETPRAIDMCPPIPSMNSVSLTLGRHFSFLFRRHREAFFHPRLPVRRLVRHGFGRVVAVEVEAQRDHALAAETDCAKRADTRPRLVEPQQHSLRTLAAGLHVFYEPAERGYVRGSAPALPGG